METESPIDSQPGQAQTQRGDAVIVADVAPAGTAAEVDAGHGGGGQERDKHGKHWNSLLRGKFTQRSSNRVISAASMRRSQSCAGRHYLFGSESVAISAPGRAEGERTNSAHKSSTLNWRIGAGGASGAASDPAHRTTVKANIMSDIGMHVSGGAARGVEARQQHRKCGGAPTRTTPAGFGG